MMLGATVLLLILALMLHSTTQKEGRMFQADPENMRLFPWVSVAPCGCRFECEREPPSYTKETVRLIKCEKYRKE